MPFWLKKVFIETFHFQIVGETCTSLWLGIGGVAPIVPTLSQVTSMNSEKTTHTHMKLLTTLKGYLKKAETRVVSKL